MKNKTTPTAIATSKKGFLRRDLLVALKHTIASIAKDSSNPSSGADIGESGEYACSLVAELVTSGGPLEVAATILDVYAEAKIVNGNKWTASAMDDVVTDLNVFCSGSHTTQCSTDPIFMVIVRLLCRLTMLVCHAAKTGVASSERREHIFLGGFVLPSDVSIGEDGMVQLDPLSVMCSNTPPQPSCLRSVVVKTLQTRMKTGANEEARALIMLVMSRNGRTVKQYNAMHSALLRRSSGTYRTQEQTSLGEDIPEDSCVSWRPLVFGVDASYSNTQHLNIVGAKKNARLSCRSDDAAWALWRTIHMHVSDPAMEEAQDFVTRLASLYSFRWTAARRHIRVNLMLYACTIAMRGHVRCEPPDDEFLELIDVVEARVSHVVTVSMNEVTDDSIKELDELDDDRMLRGTETHTATLTGNRCSPRNEYYYSL